MVYWQLKQLKWNGVGMTKQACAILASIKNSKLKRAAPKERAASIIEDHTLESIYRKDRIASHKNHVQRGRRLDVSFPCFYDIFYAKTIKYIVGWKNVDIQKRLQNK